MKEFEKVEPSEMKGFVLKFCELEAVEYSITPVTMSRGGDE